MPPHPTFWRSTLILSPHLSLGFSKWSLSLSFPAKTLYAPLLFPIRTTYTAHLIPLDWITRTKFGEQYRSLSSSLCSFLHCLVISSLSGPNILNTPFSNTLSLRSSHNVSDQIQKNHDGHYSHKHWRCLSLLAAISVSLYLNQAPVLSPTIAGTRRTTLATATFRVLPQVIAMAAGNGLNCETCRRLASSAGVRTARGVRAPALETHNPDCQRQTCVFSSWLRSSGVYCGQDLALNRPWHKFTLVRCSQTF